MKPEFCPNCKTKNDGSWGWFCWPCWDSFASKDQKIKEFYYPPEKPLIDLIKKVYNESHHQKMD